MQSIDLIRENLRRSESIVLARVEEMRDHALAFPTPNGGCHTLWVLGHLAYVEALVVRGYMLGETSPLAAGGEIVDGAEISGEVGDFPPFDEVLTACRATRAATLVLLESLAEDDLDRRSVGAPDGVEELFGTHRRCLQYAADHWFMHRGHLADARRAAGVKRAWY